MRIIQFLNWDFESITNYLDYVKEMNFDAIQINPAQPFIDVPGYEWWASYQPLDFKIGNIYGTKEDLITLCKEASKRGIKIFVDVITNHLANDGAGRETIPNRNINPKIRDNKDFWKRHSKVYDFNSYDDIIKESIGLPGLNLKNEELQDIILNFLEELKDCGVSGFRFDAAKHIGLPSDDVSYFTRVKEFLDKNNLIGYGEFLDGPNNINKDLTKTIYEKKDELSELMYILTEEDSLVENNSKKITFVESHDTFLNEYGHTKNKSTEKIIEEYVELTKQYENTLFYVRDNSRGKRLFTRDADRCGYTDKTWINNEKIRQANLNKGNEKNIENRKESIKMENDKRMELHHELSMKIHEIILSGLNENNSVSDYIDMALLDYNIQMVINSLLGVTPYDDFLMTCITNEFYKDNWKHEPLKRVRYSEFCKLVLSELKKTIINDKVKDGLDIKIKSLTNK